MPYSQGAVSRMRKGWLVVLHTMWMLLGYLQYRLYLF